MARRALDYLVGFNISPILWTKLPGSKSAGRVQSVALRLVCERELEIEKFIIEEYWTISGIFEKPAKNRLNALQAKPEFNTELSIVSIVGGRGVGKSTVASFLSGNESMFIVSICIFL